MNDQTVLLKALKCLSEEPPTPDTIRKHLVLSSKAAAKHLSNQSSTTIVEENYIQYEQAVNRSPFIAELDKRNLKLEAKVSQFNPTKYLKPLPCSNTVTCKANESVSIDEIEQFCSLFEKKSTNQKPQVKPKSKIAKNFAPQTCGSKHKWQIMKEDTEESTREAIENEFKTAREELKVQQLKKGGSAGVAAQNGGQKKKLGMKRGVQGKFVSPLLSNSEIEEPAPKSNEWLSEQEVDERLKNIEPKMVELIRSEIMDNGPSIGWDDIAGLEFAKTAIQEAVVWPMLRPDIFTGLRRPPKGILLFGPPGTGKTLIGKCVASQSKSTFFSISASSLTSKWIGDGEKMVRALFSVARCHQPAVIFIDEIDSLLSQRSDSEHESSRRIKTEFLVQLDGATTDNDERLLVIGATNRPQELDEAARRRFTKRLYIPLPVFEARKQLVQQLMKSESHLITEEEFSEIAKLADGYSGADLKNLCSEAALGPIRSIDLRFIEKIEANDVRPVSMNDFEKAFLRVKSSVAEKDLEHYISWNKTYGSDNSF